VVVVSKSGGTKETRNGMMEAQEHFTKAGLNFSKHAVAVTGVGSELDKYAESNGWLARFPMFDWIGGPNFGDECGRPAASRFAGPGHGKNFSPGQRRWTRTRASPCAKRTQRCFWH
jgi:hypothetical protein